MSAKDELPKITADELRRRLRARSTTPKDERHTCPGCDNFGGLSGRPELRHLDGYTHRCTSCRTLVNVKTGEHTHPADDDYDGAAHEKAKRELNEREQ